MAALTRHTWSTIKTEVLDRIGRPTDTAAGARVEYWIDAVYRDLCQTYHHFELDAVAEDEAVGAGAVSLDLPADLYVVVVPVLKSDAGLKLGRLTPERASFLVGRDDTTPEKPEKYARHGTKLYFPAPADVDYLVDLYYYRHPTTPDFASGGPEWDRLWDEYLIQGATDMALRGYWAAEQGAPHAEMFRDFLKRVVNPSLVSGVLRDSEDMKTTDQPHGGAQG